MNAAHVLAYIGLSSSYSVENLLNDWQKDYHLLTAPEESRLKQFKLNQGGTAYRCRAIPHTAYRCRAIPHTAYRCRAIPHTAYRCRAIPHTAHLLTASGTVYISDPYREVII